MFLQEIFKDYKFSSKVKNSNEESQARRLQDEIAEIDLQSILTARISRGHIDTSAPMSMLGFNVTLAGVEIDSLTL